MTITLGTAPLRGFTTSIRTLRGRLTVHIDKSALRKLGAGEDPASLLTTLDLHMQRLHALALQLAARRFAVEVEITAADVWWDAQTDASVLQGAATAAGAQDLPQDLQIPRDAIRQGSAAMPGRLQSGMQLAAATARPAKPRDTS